MKWNIRLVTNGCNESHDVWGSFKLTKFIFVSSKTKKNEKEKRMKKEKKKEEKKNAIEAALYRTSFILQIDLLENNSIQSRIRKKVINNAVPGKIISSAFTSEWYMLRWYVCTCIYTMHTPKMPSFHFCHSQSHCPRLWHNEMR